MNRQAEEIESRHFKKKTFLVWLCFVAVIFFLYVSKHETFNLRVLQDAVEHYHVWVLIGYLALLSVLGLTFLPSTPFAVAGVLLFSPVYAYIINLVGIITSSTIVYHFARYLGLHHAFESAYPVQIARIRRALRKKELPIIIGWSFFPIVPTDAIIYVGSTLSIPLWKCLLGVLLGEGTLNAFYIFSLRFVLDTQ